MERARQPPAAAHPHVARAVHHEGREQGQAGRHQVGGHPLGRAAEVDAHPRRAADHASARGRRDLVVFVLVAFAVGCSLLLSALYVRYRDIQPIWEVVLQLLFYASPVIYAIEIIPNQTARQAIMCNPVATLLQQSRHWLIDPSAQSASSAIGGTTRLMIPIGIAMVVGLLGIWVFHREAPRIAEEL